jgi:predicted branched-subunit amino acid permease
MNAREPLVLTYPQWQRRRRRRERLMVIGGALAFVLLTSIVAVAVGALASACMAPEPAERGICIGCR